MGNPNDAQPVPLVADNLQTLPGGGVRMLNAIVMLNGQPTSVLMQVVSVADADGRILSDRATLEMMSAVLGELRAMRRLLAQIAQVPEAVAGPIDDPGIPP